MNEHLKKVHIFMAELTTYFFSMTDGMTLDGMANHSIKFEVNSSGVQGMVLEFSISPNHDDKTTVVYSFQNSNHWTNERVEQIRKNMKRKMNLYTMLFEDRVIDVTEA